MTRPEISFEFFPPRNIEATFRLWDTVQVLSPLAPRFVSVTYGAGGTTRELTRDVVSTLHKHSGLRVAAHLTCVDATRDETLAIAAQFREAGVTDIVALRGDPPKGATGFTAHPDGFGSSVELIEALREAGDFNIRVGAYPDTHPEAGSARADVEWLKRKLDAGATEALTQFFFEPETFFRFRDACEKAGIDKPIVPGIFPVENWKGARRFAESCGTKIPAWVIEAFDKAEQDGRQDLLATSLCTELCSELLDGGVEQLHFYTLNRPELTRDVCHALGVTASSALNKVA
ncbi:5,10-methylenetetrahydrofolate reductase [Salipiger aestuarii]|uniref:Methylenetetrahydrofolate reductase n=1 Tax=Salipiger aestuarii TaxID=568098 RepID=A0A327YPY1_9RHOB|nr:methylenetetrahydrofolate reductase [NAD(P)H] [Salipiger aestuarii]EIE50690.1 5,10-methylenetetrahydrofolate reductase [Citreicella sp. 357]KAA8607307.1 5,10-methylenetetrahydrofolate reductase [Salipiger aestuarii]KAA8613001.1 5,10-methylenetetrahydrofolate reductase [Salipiger aestuarii]KAB2543780.1 5,10-methylenetetrahydrofolate reductase [Salipiger aestuarii]RAK23033.1 5,10-methylenetetrahydrofolate reductase (NAD(P)) [Salipiger aestuarii]